MRLLAKLFAALVSLGIAFAISYWFEADPDQLAGTPADYDLDNYFRYDYDRRGPDDYLRVEVCQQDADKDWIYFYGRMQKRDYEALSSAATVPAFIFLRDYHWYDGKHRPVLWEDDTRSGVALVRLQNPIAISVQTDKDIHQLRAQEQRRLKERKQEDANETSATAAASSATAEGLELP
jgi:hypothetical protein